MRASDVTINIIVMVVAIALLPFAVPWAWRRAMRLSTATFFGYGGPPLAIAARVFAALSATVVACMLVCLAGNMAILLYHHWRK